MEVAVKIHKEDLIVFASVNKHSCAVVVPTESQAQDKPKVVRPPASDQAKKVLRQRIFNFVALQPGASTTEIRKGVRGFDGFIHDELKVMRKDGTLRLVESGTTIRHHLANLPKC